ncbi:hypothetical protein [Psychrobacter sp. AOP7-A1-24]|uniref:hypothetical protein n=1 Tax=Psychrobacter sp. AOP7-A1-24 TaxID=3457646 RepID=UPI00402BE791
MSIKKFLSRKNPNAIKDLINNAAKLRAEKLSVGVVDADAMHIDRDTGKSSGLTIAEVAAINEFGVERHPIGGNRVPARPFMGPSVRKHRGEYAQMIAKDLPKVTIGLKRKKTMYDKVGKKMVLDMKHFIKDGNFVPLSPQQIKKKGHAAPLFHTFQMMDAIDYKVDKK